MIVYGGEEVKRTVVEEADPELHRQRVRFMTNMRRHVRATDKGLTDAEQSVAVINRWRADRGLALIDPNE
jgi:hypothetical protein